MAHWLQGQHNWMIMGWHVLGGTGGWFWWASGYRISLGDRQHDKTMQPGWHPWTIISTLHLYFLNELNVLQ